MVFRKFNKLNCSLLHSAELFKKNYYRKDNLEKIEGIMFRENIPYEIEGGYLPPQFHIKDLASDLKLVNNVKCLGIDSFSSNPEGLEKFVNIEELALVNNFFSYKEVVKAVGKKKAFFEVDLLWYPKLTQLSVSRLDNVLNLEKTKIEFLSTDGNHVIKELNNVDFPDSLKHVLFSNASKLKDISLCKKIKNLTQLKVTELNNLIDLQPLRETSYLEELIIWGCKKIDLTTLISPTIKKLEIYKESETKDKAISSLDFIKNLPNLEHIDLTCKIEDNDLTPLIEHHNLKTFSIEEQKSYNYTEQEIIEKRKAKGFPIS